VGGGGGGGGGGGDDLICKAKGLNFDEFKLRRIHRERAVATWNLATTSV